MAQKREREFQKLTGGFHDTLEDNDNLKLLVRERALGEVKKGALGIDLVADGERGYQEELICARPKAHIQFTLVQRQELALGGLTGLEDRKELRIQTKGSKIQLQQTA